jgi:hypothetical protein
MLSPYRIGVAGPRLARQSRASASPSSVEPGGVRSENYSHGDVTAIEERNRGDDDRQRCQPERRRPSTTVPADAAAAFSRTTRAREIGFARAAGRSSYAPPRPEEGRDEEP